MNRNTLVRAASAVALVGLAATSSVAQTSAPPAQASAMNFQQVTDRLAAQGFRDIREIERKSEKLYEIKARDEKGQSVELYVDSRSGEVLRREVKRFDD